MYEHAESLVRIGSTLTAPFAISCGVRQGDPLPAPLFSLVMDPFLRYLHSCISPYAFKMSEHTITSCCYADDLTVFISDNRGFPVLHDALQTYEHISGASINASKSQGLFSGAWRTRRDSPLNFQWSAEGWKFLGIFLGNSAAWEARNWDLLLSDVNHLTARWSRFFPGLSYRGRAILVNQFIGSKLSYRLAILQLPPGFLSQLQSSINKFIWSGKHWLHPNFLYFPLNDGGLGLQNVQVRLQLQRFKFLRDYLSSQQPTITHDLTTAMLHEMYPRIPGPSLFLLDGSFRLTHFNPFYDSVLQVWTVLKSIPLNVTLTWIQLSQLPLHRNCVYLSSILTSASERDWEQVGIYTIGDLQVSPGVWKHLHDFNMSHLTTPCKRRLSTSHATILNHCQQLYDGKHGTSSYTFGSHLLHPTRTDLFCLRRSTLYSLFLEITLPRQPRPGRSTFQIGNPIQWKTLYTSRNIPMDVAVVWRLLYGRIVTPIELFRWKKFPSPYCPWCTCHVECDAEHLVFLCAAVTKFWSYIWRFIVLLKPNVLCSQQILVRGFTDSDTPSALANHLLTLAKSVICTHASACFPRYPAYPQYKVVYNGQLRRRLMVEFYASTKKGTMPEFNSFWAFQHILCKEDEGELMFMF